MKGLPQGGTLCPRLFTLCLNPVVWRLRATEGYRLSKPIGVKVTDLLYIDELKVFAASESKLNQVVKETRGAMHPCEITFGIPRKKILGIPKNS